jgi:hypothetical protein
LFEGQETGKKKPASEAGGTKESRRALSHPEMDAADNLHSARAVVFHSRLLPDFGTFANVTGSKAATSRPKSRGENASKVGVGVRPDEKDCPG